VKKWAIINIVIYVKGKDGEHDGVLMVFKINIVRNHCSEVAATVYLLASKSDSTTFSGILPELAEFSLPISLIL
jgi:hypothetical protein